MEPYHACCLRFRHPHLLRKCRHVLFGTNTYRRGHYSARVIMGRFLPKKREISFDVEDQVCEEITQTLFCTPQDIPDTVFLRNLVWEELDAALSELPPEQSEVFCLTVFDGMPVKDISNATGIPTATLLSRKHYAVKYLRKRFHDLYDALISQD